MKKLAVLVAAFIFYVPMCGSPAPSPKPGEAAARGLYISGYGCTEPYRRYTSYNVDGWQDNLNDYGPYQTFCSEGWRLYY